MYWHVLTICCNTTGLVDTVEAWGALGWVFLITFMTCIWEASVGEVMCGDNNGWDGSTIWGWGAAVVIGCIGSCDWGAIRCTDKGGWIWGEGCAIVDCLTLLWYFSSSAIMEGWWMAILVGGARFCCLASDWAFKSCVLTYCWIVNSVSLGRLAPWMPGKMMREPCWVLTSWYEICMGCLIDDWETDGRAGCSGSASSFCFGRGSVGNLTHSVISLLDSGGDGKICCADGVKFDDCVCTVLATVVAGCVSSAAVATRVVF